jgi:hypothetical protein
MGDTWQWELYIGQGGYLLFSHAKIIHLVSRDGMIYAHLVFRIISKTGLKLARLCHAHNDRAVGSFYAVLTAKQLILQKLYIMCT